MELEPLVVIDGPKNGTLSAAAPARPEAPSLDAIRDDAVEWAKEAGLNAPFHINGPERTPFGYVVTLQEATPNARIGRTRMGTAYLRDNGARSMWSIDGAAMW